MDSRIQLKILKGPYFKVGARSQGHLRPPAVHGVTSDAKRSQIKSLQGGLLRLSQ